MAIEVSGTTEVFEGWLEVRVGLANRGDTPAGPLVVDGELLGSASTARLEKGLPAGETRHVLLRHPFEVPRPGLHLLALLLDFTIPDGTRMSQRAFLLLALGATPAPAVRLFVADGTVDFYGILAVGLESADGAPHRVAVRVLTPKGLRATAPEGPVEVPAAGRVTAGLRIFRGDAPRGTTQGILVIASAVGENQERTTVATGVVRVAAETAWMPRLRWPLAAVAALLLAASGYAEWRRSRA